MAIQLRNDLTRTLICSAQVANSHAVGVQVVNGLGEFYQGGTVYLMAEAGNNTVYLLTFAEASQTFGAWSFTNRVLNDATIAAAAGNVYIAGRDSADRILLVQRDREQLVLRRWSGD